MAKKNLAWTSSATAVWSGELRGEFREVASAIVGRPLSDDQWYGLCSTVRAYAALLSHEHSAVKSAEQIEAVQRAAQACAKLIQALQTIQQPEYGSLLTGLVSDKWEEISHRQKEAERNFKKMADAVDHLVGAPGAPPADADEEDLDDDQVVYGDTPGGLSVRAWLFAGMLMRPSLGADLLVDLWEAEGALRLTATELRSSDEHRMSDGYAFMEFVGRLDAWQAGHGFGLGTSNQEGKWGRLTKLVRAIIEEVPILKNEDGRRAERQIRYWIASDSALAQAVLKARKEYKARTVGV